MDFEILGWDSSFFGFTVGKIKPPVLDAEALGEVLDLLKARGATLVYWPASNEDPDVERAADRWGGFLADEKRTYRISWNGEDSSRPLAKEISLYDEARPSETLRALALRSGNLSRFKVDPRFPPALFERLYHTWIEKAVAGESGERVWVYRLGETIAGMVTVGPKLGGRSTIGLIAVAPGFEGRGIGRELVGAAREWSLENHLKVGQVVTQAANRAACGLYEKCGYELERTERFYHFWLKEI